MTRAVLMQYSGYIWSIFFPTQHFDIFQFQNYDKSEDNVVDLTALSAAERVKAKFPSKELNAFIHLLAEALGKVVNYLIQFVVSLLMFSFYFMYYIYFIYLIYFIHYIYFILFIIHFFHFFDLFDLFYLIYLFHSFYYHANVQVYLLVLFIDERKELIYVSQAASIIRKIENAL